MGGSGTVEFRVLGPLEVLVHGRPVPLGAAKQRLVLAALLADANAVVSIDRLVDIVWGELPPDSAQGTLQKYVYRLRGAIEAERSPGDPARTLLTRPPGYLLALRSDQLDAARFHDLLRAAQGRATDGDLEHASSLLDEALGLWRGPAWAEFADYDFARAETTRLESLRAVAIEDRAEIALAAGRHAELIGELEATVARYPLRERPRAQLMLALYRSGRQAEALRAYQAFRSYLIDEVGLEPSLPLQDLEGAIVRNRPDLDWTGTRDEAAALVLVSRQTPAPSAAIRSRLEGLLPTGTVTFCFTDIEGSTRLLRHLRDRYGDVLERHRQLLRAAVADHGGTEVNAEGDGLFFAFGSATSAIAACTAGQVAIAEERWPENISLRVRMGLHTGEASPDRGDYVALAVHQAARVAAAAHGGQILVSEVTAAAVGEALDPSTTVRDLGPYGLEDFERPIKLLQVCHPRLQSGFPPPRAAGVPAPMPSRMGEQRQLPAELGREVVPLLGRSQDLEWLEVLWQRALVGEAPVALVSGPHGIGKTALLAEFARRVHAMGADVAYVSCGQLVGTPHSVAEAVRGSLPRDGGDQSRRSRQSAHETSAATPEASEQTVASLAGQGPVLVALDDLECSMSALVALVEPLRASLAAEGLLVLGALLEPDGGAYHGDSSPPAWIHLRRLEGLSLEDVGLALARGREPRRPQLVEAVHAETAGNPAQVLDMARRLQDQDASARVERALARAEAASHDTSIVDEIAGGILERRRLSDRPSPAVEGLDLASAPVCPYKGLARFEVADAGYFCGRERLVATLIARLAVARFVGIIGASGSGKSSLVRAGLMATLAGGALPGSEHWPIVISTPGPDPLGNLAVALSGPARRPAPELRRLLEANPEEIEGVARTALSTHPEARLVLVLDQFEELVTVCRNGEARQRLIDVVINATVGADSPMVVVVVLRGDYYAAFAAYPELARLLEKSQVLVGAMTETELRRAIVEPGRRAGLTVEAGLVEAVFRDAGGEPGALPLVSTALLETWVRRHDHTLTLAGYVDAGGVRGALTRLAEEVYGGFDAHRQAIARRLFLRLAEPGHGREDLRRRVPRSELALGAETDTVVDTLVDRRLLTADEKTVEVAHEALLREWPRLRAWLEEDREGRRLHRQLTESAVTWEAEGRDPSALYRGARLAAASDWAGAHPEDPNPLEREFLDVSLAAQDRELRMTRRSARRLRSLAGGLAVVMVLALIAGSVALVQRSNARHEATTADAARLATQARALADKNLDLSLLLAVEARHLQPSVATDGALEATLGRTPPGLDHLVHLTPPAGISNITADGRLVIAPGDDGAVRLIDVSSGRTVRALAGSVGSGSPEAILASDDNRVLVGGSNGSVMIWNLHTGAREATIPAGGGTVYGAFAGTNPLRVVTASTDGSVALWDLSDTAHPRQVGDPLRVPVDSIKVPVVWASPDGRRAAAGGVAGRQAFVFDLTSHSFLRQLPGVAAGFSPDGTTLATALGDRIMLWDLATGLPRGAPLTGFSYAYPYVAFSTDGNRLAAGDLIDNQVRVFDLATDHQVAAALPQSGSAHPIRFLTDGRLASATSGEISLSRVAAPAIPPMAIALEAPPDVTMPTTGPNGGYLLARFAGHGTQVVTQAGPGAPLLRWETSTGRLLGPLFDGQGALSPFGFWVSPDGTLLAAPRADGTAQLWEVATGQRRAAVNTDASFAYLAWRPAGGMLVSLGVGGQLGLWRISNSGQASPLTHARVEDVATVSGGRVAAAPSVSPDGRVIALVTGGAQNTVTLVGTSGQRLRSLHLDGPWASMDFSSDSKTLATASAQLNGGGQVILWDVATGARRASLSLPYTPASEGLRFARDGSWLVTTQSGASIFGSAPSGATRVDLWDTRTLQPIGDPLTVPADAVHLWADRAGDTLATGATASNGVPLVWSMEPASWEATACHIAGRNLTQSEWNHYLGGRPYQTTCSEWPAGT